MNIIRLLKPKSTVLYLSAASTLKEGLEIMRSHSFTALPVVEADGHYLGTVSEGDFLEKIVDSYPACMEQLDQILIGNLVREGFNPAVRITMAMDDLLLQVMDQNFVPVVDDRNTFVGIVTRRDVLKYFYDKERQPVRQKQLVTADCSV